MLKKVILLTSIIALTSSPVFSKTLPRNKWYVPKQRYILVLERVTYEDYKACKEDYNCFELMEIDLSSGKDKIRFTHKKFDDNTFKKDPKK